MYLYSCSDLFQENKLFGNWMLFKSLKLPILWSQYEKQTPPFYIKTIKSMVSGVHYSKLTRGDTSNSIFKYKRVMTKQIGI